MPSILDLFIEEGPDIYYDAGFRKVLEDHMTWIRDNYCEVVVVSPDKAYQYRSDFFGLMQDMNIPTHFHWVMMRINKYTSPGQFTQDTVSLLRPNFDVIDKIRQMHNSTSRIS